METTDYQILYSDILRKCSVLALNMNMLPTAFSLLSKLLSYDSTDIRSLLLLTNAHLKNKNYVETIHLLINAINSNIDFIVNDYRLWKLLAFAYYKLNKYYDAHHAISQALSSVTSPSLVYERQQIKLNHNYSSYSSSHPPATNHTHNKTGNNVPNINSNYHNNNNSNTNNRILSYTVLLPKEEHKFLKCKILVLNCRISLLAPEKTHYISLLLSDFQLALSQIEFNENISLYLEVLITRAQMFRKYNLMDKCRRDLIQCLTILNENKEKFKREDLSHKVAYCYYFSIIIEFMQNSDLQLALKLIKEIQTNFRLPAVYLQKFLVLEAYIRTIHNPNDAKDFVERLKLEIPIVTDTVKPKLFYALGRLTLQNPTADNIETAYNYYQDALNVTPTDPVIWISIASLYFELGQFEDALSTYSQAASLASSSEFLQNCTMFEVRFYKKFTALGLFGMSQVYYATDRINNAISSINKAINIFKMEKDKIHIDELEEIKNKLWNSQTNRRRFKGLRTTTQEIKNNEKELSDNEKVSSKIPRNNIEKDYTIPDVPLGLLAEFETYQDQNVFTCEYELDPVNLMDPELEATFDGNQLTQDQPVSLMGPSNVTQPIDINVNNFPSASNHGSVHYAKNSTKYEVTLNNIQPVPNQAFLHVISHDPKNTAFESPGVSNPELSTDSNKVVAITNQKQHKRTFFPNHIGESPIENFDTNHNDPP